MVLSTIGVLSTADAVDVAGADSGAAGVGAREAGAVGVEEAAGDDGFAAGVDVGGGAVGDDDPESATGSLPCSTTQDAVPTPPWPCVTVHR